MSIMVSSAKKHYKYFIGYKYDDHKIKPLHIMLPKTKAYVKSYEGQTKCMYFLIEDDELLEELVKRTCEPIVNPSTTKKF